MMGQCWFATDTGGDCEVLEHSSAERESPIAKKASTEIPDEESGPGSGDQKASAELSNDDYRSGEPSTEIPDEESGPGSGDQKASAELSNDDYRSGEPSTEIPDEESGPGSGDQKASAEISVSVGCEIEVTEEGSAGRLT